MKYVSLLLGALFVLSPLVASAQTATLTATQKQEMIAALYAELEQLEQEIQLIEASQQLAQEAATPIVQPQMSPAQQQETQQAQYQENCVNLGVANNEAAGLDASQAYVKAIIGCPQN